MQDEIIGPLRWTYARRQRERNSGRKIDSLRVSRSGLVWGKTQLTTWKEAESASRQQLVSSSPLSYYYNYHHHLITGFSFSWYFSSLTKDKLHHSISRFHNVALSLSRAVFEERIFLFWRNYWMLTEIVLAYSLVLQLQFQYFKTRLLCGHFYGTKEEFRLIISISFHLCGFLFFVFILSCADCRLVYLGVELAR